MQYTLLRGRSVAAVTSGSDLNIAYIAYWDFLELEVSGEGDGEGDVDGGEGGDGDGGGGGGVGGGGGGVHEGGFLVILILEQDKYICEGINLNKLNTDFNLMKK